MNNGCMSLTRSKRGCSSDSSPLALDARFSQFPVVGQQLVDGSGFVKGDQFDCARCVWLYKARRRRP